MNLAIVEKPKREQLLDTQFPTQYAFTRLVATPLRQKIRIRNNKSEISLAIPQFHSRLVFILRF